jgi:hypothetical protein
VEPRRVRSVPEKVFKHRPELRRASFLGDTDTPLSEITKTASKQNAEACCDDVHWPKHEGIPNGVAEGEDRTEKDE